MEFNLENPFTSFNDHHLDAVPALFAGESDHMPSLLSFNDDQISFSIRREAFSLTYRTQFVYKFDRSIAYLAMNYIDRFLSRQAVLENKPWVVRILVISCLSLAAKMRCIDLCLSDIQRDEGLMFDSQSVHRMEGMILSSLKWRLRSITPFSFLHFFTSLYPLEDPSIAQSLIHRASTIIFTSHYDIKLFEYNPSVIAASALLYVAEKLIPMQFLSFKNAIFRCEYVKSDEILNCLSVMRETVTRGIESSIDAMSDCSLTPRSVLRRESVECAVKLGSKKGGEKMNVQSNCGVKRKGKSERIPREREVGSGKTCLLNWSK
nr:putative cyclin-D6-1 [Ipomoea batatas]